MAISGGCLCGAVRYSVDAQPLMTRVCWCRLCQYIGAGSGTVNAVFPSATFKVDGELSMYACTADSGNRMQRRFCPRCGTPMFSAAEARPDLVIVRAGTLDDPELAEPKVTIWAAAAPSWAVIDLDIPCLEGQPPPPPLP